MRKLILIFSICCLLAYPPDSQAQESQPASGVALDKYFFSEKGKASDIFEYELKLKNNSGQKMNLYAIVSDITPEGGRRRFDETSPADKTNSIARWIEISRGRIEIGPGQETAIPVKIQINMYAEPGKYLGEIAFAASTNRYEAEDLAEMNNVPKALFDFTVEDNLVERLQLAFFRPRLNVFFAAPAWFDLKMANNGNTSLAPQGKIYIYNRHNQSETEIDINSQQEAVEAGEIFAREYSWDPGRKFGKYKAKLEVNYGEKAERDVQDVLYFWILPWKYLAVFLALILALLILAMLIGARSASRKEMKKAARGQKKNNKKYDEKTE